MITKLNGGLYTDLLAFTLKMRKIRKTSARGPSSPQMGSLPPNEVGRIAQHARNEKKEELGVLLSTEPMAAARKSFKLAWWCHKLLSGFLAKGQLPRVSRQPSRSVANDKGCS